MPQHDLSRVDLSTLITHLQKRYKTLQQYTATTATKLSTVITHLQHRDRTLQQHTATTATALSTVITHIQQRDRTLQQHSATTLCNNCNNTLQQLQQHSLHWSRTYNSNTDKSAPISNLDLFFLQQWSLYSSVWTGSQLNTARQFAMPLCHG